MTVLNSQYFLQKLLRRFWDTLGEENKDDYIKYVQLILYKYKQKRYICKNNYNYKRINLIKRIFPNSFFFDFRDPYLTSLSLLNQHRKFAILHKKIFSLENI